MPQMARVWIGTSGFSYKEWKGSFYPAGLPAGRMLEFYASRFASVEIDSTFYRMPAPKRIEGWVAATPEGFRFSIKAPQRITHRERLKTPSEALAYWTATVPLLGGRLGCVLYQLPPFFHCDLPRLEAFLETAGPLPSAFEFRHDSWWIEEVFQLLERYGAGLCIHDADQATTPLRLTASRTYIRLRRSAYSARERDQWLERFRGWAAGGVDVFAYIKHEGNPEACRIALEFAGGLGGGPRWPPLV
jgi:uncharacterized protein YecE (DUF72 family)